MSFLNANNIGISFGDRTLFSGASFEIGEKDRIGIVGANGVGKTSLFKAITGEYSLSEGEIYISKNANVGYMEQHVCSNSNKTLYDEMLEVFSEVQAVEKELESINAQIESSDKVDELIEKQALLQSEFERLGGLTYKSRVRSAILGLGFDEKDFSLTCDKLSGGQRSKISLGRLLLSGANFLLLDEPTNHLDIKSVEWLEGFLNGFQGSVMIISHDRWFLDKVTNRTMEIEHKRIRLTDGNYSRHLELKKVNAEIERRHYDNTMKEVERIEGIIAQQRQWNKEKNIKTAESKQKQIDRMLKDVVKPDEDIKTLNFSFEQESVSSNEVLHINALSKSFGGKQLFSGVDMLVERGENVFLLGDNGTGKTTLLKIVMGFIQADGGKCEFGTSVKPGYFDQTLSGLNLDKTVIEDVWDAYPSLSATRIRSALAVFLFGSDDIEKRIATLSGGERARAALLKIMLSGANFLVLDEPTNHLDIASREALENALLGYDGTMLVVSHDRYFINKLADRIVKIKTDGVENYLGNYDYYVAKSVPPQEKAETKTKPPKVNEYKLKKEAQSEIRKLKAAIKRFEERIDELDGEIERLNAEMSSEQVASDYTKVAELGGVVEKLTLEQEKIYEKWETAQQRLLQIESEV